MLEVWTSTAGGRGHGPPLDFRTWYW